MTYWHMKLNPTEFVELHVAAVAICIAYGGRGVEVRSLPQFAAIFRNFPAIFLTCPSYVPAGVVQGHHSELLRSVPCGIAIFPQCSTSFPHFPRNFSQLDLTPPDRNPPPPPRPRYPPTPALRCTFVCQHLSRRAIAVR